ncbi:MAG: hypothetical protein IPK58_15585 [Acidobacteria bacterium]|nr:hypothetical protein [Acidobacteriota bacterium]
MDNRSPAHSDFQVYDRRSESPATMAYHASQELREPTDEEMNLMVDEIRVRYRTTFGEEAYNQAVSEEQRKTH